MKNKEKNVFLSVLPLMSIGIIAIALSVLRVYRCPFRIITGYPCPGCGCTRAVLNIFKGDIKKSIEYNPIPLIALILIVEESVSYCIFGKTPVRDFVDSHPRTSVILGAILFVCHVYNNMHNPLLS